MTSHDGQCPPTTVLNVILSHEEAGNAASHRGELETITTRPSPVQLEIALQSKPLCRASTRESYHAIDFQKAARPCPSDECHRVSR